MRRPRPTLAAGILAAVLAAALAACGSEGLPLLPQGSATFGDGALVVVEWRGGHCRVGECRSEVTITGSGRVSRDGGPDASIPGPALTALADAIRATDFGLLMGRPFTGECPTAFDGQELVYTIATPDDGTVTIASCEVEVDPSAPLFAAIERITELAPLP